MKEKSHMARQCVLASDFDQTLSFNDTGIVLSELLGISGFHEKVAGLSRLNLVQQGGELAYLLRHDPEYRCVRKEHLIEVGRRIRLKRNVEPLTWFLAQGIDNHPDCQRIIRHFFAQEKPVAQLCHTPLALLAAGVLTGKRTAAYPTLEPDITAAGAQFADVEAGLDGLMVSHHGRPRPRPLQPATG